jgi:hypothetical protein
MRGQFARVLSHSTVGRPWRRKLEHLDYAAILNAMKALLPKCQLCSILDVLKEPLLMAKVGQNVVQ